MIEKNIIKFIIIGENNLSLECGNIIISQGHQIIALVSESKLSKQWADKYKITCINTIKDLENSISNLESFDYLLSIVNSKILPSSILTLPRQCSINYHDSVLPTYAGRHATSWAILNGEHTHGITWHIMEDVVDEGKILEQSLITISPVETTLSLNVKCYDKAVSSFKNLLKNIENGNIQYKAQDLTKRSYFALHQKPDRYGCVSWDKPAKEIDNLVRALNFGTYDNTFCTPKIIINQSYYIINQLKILETCSHKPAGSLIKISCCGIQISTQTKDILITELSDQFGTNIPFNNLYNKIKDHKVIAINPMNLNNLNDYAIQIGKHESFWKKELLKTKHTELFQLNHKNTSIKQAKKILKISLDTKSINQIKSTANYCLNTIVLSAILILLNRLNNQKQTSVCIDISALTKNFRALDIFLSKYIPFSVQLNTNTSVIQLFDLIQAHLNIINSKATFFKDILFRYQELKDIHLNNFIKILFIENLDNFKPIVMDGITFIISKNPDCAYLCGDEILLSQTNLINFSNIANRLNILLNEISTNTNQYLNTINIISSAERERILFDFNDTFKPFPNNECIHNLIEHQARKTPDNIALIYEDKELTYKELNSQAELLSLYLVSLGVKSEIIVGVCLQRSFELVISLLAILKAGGAYVPLDPEYPSERISYMLKDTQCKIILTNSNFINLFDKNLYSVITLDNNWQKKYKISPDKYISLPQSDPQNLAYVIYTSGSTGKPKGVLSNHIGLVNRITWMQNQYQITSKDKVLQKTPFTFDVSLWEFFWPLVAGASLVLAKPHQHKDVFYLCQVIEQYQISIIHFVPSMLHTFLTSGVMQKCNSLKKVFSSGEMLSHQTLKIFFKYLNCELHNLYGPTEASIDVTYWRCEYKQHIKKVLIGKPIANTQIYILDVNQNLLSIGATGEIYIGGVGLARGYLNQPELTKNAFVNNPYYSSYKKNTFISPIIYRTGDLGRFDSSGNIEYVGRIDDQIKLRGFRIELKEIEILLNSQNDIIQLAHVIVLENTMHQKQLVAYVIPKEKAKCKTLNNELIAEIKNRLKKILPAFMIPEAFVILAKIPLTSNGKLDRKSLPLPDINAFNRNIEHLAPTNYQELKLLAILERILGISPINMNDNFFNLGGNSLLATQVIANIRTLLNKELSLVDIFNTKNLKEFALKLQEVKQSDDSINSFLIEERPKKLPLSFCQQRLWILDQIVENQSAYNIPFVVNLSGDIKIDALSYAFNQIIIRHEILRTNIVKFEGVPYQEIKQTINFNLEIIKLDKYVNIQNLLTKSARYSFNLMSDLLINAKLFLQNDHQSILFILFHHSVCDETSLNVLLSELSHFYNKFIGKEHKILDTLVCQYADFSLWQHKRTKSKDYEKQLAYWLRYLDNAPQLLTIPTDKPRPHSMSNEGKTISIPFPQKLSIAIQKFRREQNISLFITILTSLNILLSYYSGQTDIVIGTPINERRHVETAKLIGCFVNTLILRTKIDLKQSFIQLLAKVKNDTFAAFENTEVPFQNIINSLKVKRQINRIPLIQVVFSVQDEELKLSFDEINYEIISCFNDTSKVDLTFYLLENKMNGLIMNIEYSTDLYEESTIFKMAYDLQRLLGIILRNHHTSIERLFAKMIKEKNDLISIENAIP